MLLRTEDPVASMAMDTTKKLYFVNNESPEITVVELGGAITRIALTSASVGTAAHTRMIPKTIRYIREKDQFLLVTRGLAADKPEFYLVKRHRAGGRHLVRSRRDSRPPGRECPEAVLVALRGKRCSPRTL